ncbi:MAG TPA: nucleoside monophosphate kinase [Terriglobia bacterium]|nr:nucleoside monophosphate kinase [Terriglobia bacterium]
MKLLCIVFAAIFAATAAAQTAEKPVVILVGPPSSGKSTQAEMIQKRYNFALITREQLLKDDPSVLARSKTPGLNGIEPRVDPALNGLFLKRLEKTDISKGLLLDGYPATKDHGDFMLKVGAQKGLGKPLLLKLEVPDAVVRQRLKGQKPEQIEQDLKDYHRETDFLSAYFPNANIVKINGEAKPDAVFDEIRKAIDKYVKR